MLASNTHPAAEQLPLRFGQAVALSRGRKRLRSHPLPDAHSISWPSTTAQELKLSSITQNCGFLFCVELSQFFSGCKPFMNPPS